MASPYETTIYPRKGDRGFHRKAISNRSAGNARITVAHSTAWPRTPTQACGLIHHGARFDIWRSCRPACPTRPIRRGQQSVTWPVHCSCIAPSPASCTATKSIRAVIVSRVYSPRRRGRRRTPARRCLDVVPRATPGRNHAPLTATKHRGHGLVYGV